MILTHVEITNYKQYGGHHHIDIPQTGAIGVIGANGVGKTTLFEAIEWALYSPTSIKSADVKPRVWRGKTEVKVTIDNPANGGRFIVERELGKGSAKARVYRVDRQGFEEKIVDGASQVTNYVTQHLIGLDHAAFVATFFTRQKELGFFNGSPTTRRRDVGKLLGLETVRDAQQLIAEDRKRAQSDARSYREQSETQLRDRDFTTEIANAEKAVGDARVSLQQTISATDAAKSATADTEKKLTTIEQQREQDNAIGQRILHTQREHDVANEQVSNATQRLDRLANLASEREKLAPLAATGAVLADEEQSHSKNRQAALRKRELEQALASLNQREHDASASMREAITTTPAPDGAEAWNPATPEVATDWAAAIDVAALEKRAADINLAIDAHEKLTVESRRLEAFLKRVNELQGIRQSLLKAGDPAERIHNVQNRLNELNASNAAANTTANRIQADLQKTERILANLRTQQEGERCPTCQRPFTTDETAHAITVFEREANTYQDQLRDINSQIGTNRQEIIALQAEQQQLTEAVKKLTETEASIESGNRYVEEQQKTVDECDTKLHTVLNTLERIEPPTVQERDAAQHELIAWRKVVDASATVNRSLRACAQIAAERMPVEEELKTLSDTSYDEAQHREVIEQLQSARQAQVTMDRIDTELARREEIVAARDAATQTVETARTALATLQQQRKELGFDPAVHHQAQQAMRTAQEQERAAIEQRHRVEVALRDSEHILAGIVADKDRIGRLAIEAEVKQREADDLDLMYKEFTEFERYAAAWYAPRLSEIASDLVAQVTDGKYDRVEFDNNFSIQVYDGDDEKFPYETFSGGERDAIALCARIALSRVIGGASSTPPGFLVLDEVFGSLDLERRQRLLEMLAAITGADDHFRQVFIISHVDDVRTSPILDDIWRIVETDDGTSELQPLSVGVDIGEL